jgi:TonB family protein
LVFPEETIELSPPIPAAKVSKPVIPAPTPDRESKSKQADILLEKKSRKKQIVNSNTVKPEVNKGQSLQTFMRTFVQAPQYFTIHPEKDTVLKGSQGTEIIIPANSFSHANGNPVQKNIKIALQEFYTIPEMIFAGLSTTSNGNPLETGGMIHLQALAEDEPLQLKPGKEITLKFPYTDQKENMQLFTGNQTADGTVNWLLTEMAPEQGDEVFQVVEHQPEPVGGMKAFYEYVRKNIKYPDEARNKGIQGRVFVQFVVDTDGSLTDIAILKGIGAGCDEEALRLIENSPKWTPGKQRGKPVKVRMSLPVVFKLDEASEGQNQNYSTPPSPSGESTLAMRSNNQASYYTLKSNSLGWINCDRFLTLNGPKTSLAIPAAAESQTSVVLIFKQYASILPPSTYIDGHYVFDNIPVNEKVVLLGMKLVGNTPYVAFREARVGQATNQEITLQYEQTTKTAFKDRIRKLIHGRE